MMVEIKRVLKPDGVLIISTPDKLYYSDKRGFKNEFHIKELYKNEFLALLSNSFKNIQLLTQQHSNGNSLVLNNDNNIDFYTGEYSYVKKSEPFKLYLIAISSNVSFQKQNNSIFDGSEILKIENALENENIYKSNSYRLGHLILKPLKVIKKIIK